MNHEEPSTETDKFYSYEQRKGTLPISWNTFFGLCKGLALAIAPYDPEIILGVARGGLYAATLLSHMLQAEFYAIRVTRRFKDQVVYDSPVWLVKPPAIVKGQRVLIVDEICGEGKTLTMAREEVEQAGASAVKIAVLYAHEQGRDIPDYIGIISDELIINPWDREIIKGGKFVPHPEYVHAFTQQETAADMPFVLGIEPLKIARG